MRQPILFPGLLLTATFIISSCDKDSNNGNTPANNTVELKNHSVTPALVKALPGFESNAIYSLIGSDDQLPESPNFIFGGSADGAGLLKNSDGTFTMLVNHEDNYSVSRISFDKTFKPVKGEYILNSTGGTWRLCSATMATPEEHGFSTATYLTCGESGEESQTHAITNLLAVATTPSTPKNIASLGRWNAENAVPLNKNAYSGKTVILIGDDDSGTEGGQVAMYLSNTPGDLANGKIYVLKRSDNNIRERDMVAGTEYNVEFVEIPNAAGMTGRAIQLASVAANSIRFGRVEDIDYKKGTAADNREIYFNVTGQNNSGVNADYSRTKYGRVYRLRLNDGDPTKGKLECILDGDDRNGAAKSFQNPDNICVTQNYVYIQEDANSYGDETHDAYIYQYNIATKELKKAFELDHRRTQADAAKYNVGGNSSFGSWEYGAMIDASDLLGVPNTFIVCIQPHTWTGDKYKNPDGGTIRINEKQASQLVVIKGLAK